MEIPENIRRILKNNDWNKFNYQLMEQNYINKLKKSYSKYEYPMTDELLEKISLFYNTRLKFETRTNRFLYFDSKTIDKYRQNFLFSLAIKFKAKQIVYLGHIVPGYVTIWIDENEKVWGEYDNYIFFYGVNLFDGIVNIINEKSENTIFVPTEEP